MKSDDGITKAGRIARLNEAIAEISSDFRVVLLADGDNISLRYHNNQVTQFGWGVTDNNILECVKYFRDNPDKLKIHPFQLSP